jgi:hypothetical protein
VFALKISQNQFCFFYISPKLPSENIYLERLPGVAEVSPSPARFFGAAFCLGSDLAFALDLPAGCGVLAAAFKSFVASLGGAGDGDHWEKPGIVLVGKIMYTHLRLQSITKTPRKSVECGGVFSKQSMSHWVAGSFLNFKFYKNLNQSLL